MPMQKCVEYPSIDCEHCGCCKIRDNNLNNCDGDSTSTGNFWCSHEGCYYQVYITCLEAYNTRVNALPAFLSEPTFIENWNIGQTT